MLESITFPRLGLSHRRGLDGKRLMSVPTIVEPVPARLRLLFEACERDFPVDRWRVGGLDVWPLIRVDLYLRWVQAFSAPSALVVEPPAGRVGGRTRRVVAIAARALGAVGASMRRPPSISSGKAAVVLLSDGISFVNQGERRFEKFCDPVASMYGEAGFACLKLDPVTPAGPGVDGWVGLGASLEGAMRRSRLQLSSSLALEDYARFADFVRRTCGLVPMAGRDVARSAEIVVAYASVFGRIVRDTGARLAFQVSYYSQVGFAFNLACRRAGIRVVDLQHGVAGDANPAYGYWSRLPQRGFELLPTDFWSWSEDEYSAIERWASGSAGQHRALPGCNLLPAFFAAGRIGPAPLQDEELGHLLAQRDATKACILLTLQPNYLTDPEWRARLNALIEYSAVRATWWVRPHPMMAGAADDIIRALPESARASVAAVMWLPLHMLLAHADMHATHSSATVREADELGVPSAVLSEIGAGFFAASIAAGRATCIVPGADIAAATERLLALAGGARASDERLQDAWRNIEAARLVLLGLLRPARADAAPVSSSAGADHTDGDRNG